MYLTSDKVINAFTCAQRILQSPGIYSGNGKLLPISIDAVHDYIAEDSGYTITMREVIFEGTYLFGRIEKYKDKTAIIDVKASLPDNWKRFIAAKELLHLIIDSEEDMSPYGDQTLEHLVREGHIGIIGANGDKPPEQSELVAEVAAMELLYPIQNRLADIEELKAKSSSQSKLAIKYGIPVNFIDTAHSSVYLRVISDAFNKL